MRGDRLEAKREESPDEEKSAHSNSITMPPIEYLTNNISRPKSEASCNLSDNDDESQSDLDLGHFPSRYSKRHNRMGSTIKASYKLRERETEALHIIEL